MTVIDVIERHTDKLQFLIINNVRAGRLNLNRLGFRYVCQTILLYYLL